MLKGLVMEAQLNTGGARSVWELGVRCESHFERYLGLPACLTYPAHGLYVFIALTDSKSPHRPVGLVVGAAHRGRLGYCFGTLCTPSLKRAFAAKARKIRRECERAAM